MDVEHILKIRASPGVRNDFLSWSPEKSDKFSVRSAYRLTHGQNDAFVVDASSMNPAEEDSFHALIVCTHDMILWLNMRCRWPLPGDDLLNFYGTEWLVTLLSKCSTPVRDMLILLLWRIWQTRNDMAHGKETAPVLATVEYFDSYYKSIVLAG
ncbi:Alpha-amylase [Hordeum vulgare]|nr:Alpha-amylase [Hordeum vulgare]